MMTSAVQLQPKIKRDGRSHCDTATKTVNCCLGCSNDCEYCWAKGMAIKYGRLKDRAWSEETIRVSEVKKKHKLYVGEKLMFPSTHDITRNNFEACYTVLYKLLAAGNHVLVFSKPRFDIIRELCIKLYRFRNQITFIFSIATHDEMMLKRWEPGASTFEERLDCVKHVFERKFKVGISAEPLLILNHTQFGKFIDKCSPFVTNNIMVSPIGSVKTVSKYVSNKITKDDIDYLSAIGDRYNLRTLYERYKNNNKITWKRKFQIKAGLNK